MNNPYRLSGQSAREYVGGPILLAVGIKMEVDSGKVDRDDPRATLAIQECHAAIADVMADALDTIETGRTTRDFTWFMDDLTDETVHWVSLSLRSHGLDPSEHGPAIAQLSASLVMGGVSFLEDHSDRI